MAPGCCSRSKRKTAAAERQEAVVDQQMQQVLHLLGKRQKGQATNEQVEKAVSQILSTAGLAPPPSSQNKQQGIDSDNKSMNDNHSRSKNQVSTSAGHQKLSSKPTTAKTDRIQMDTENYDEDDEEEDVAKDPKEEQQEKETEKKTKSDEDTTTTTTTTNVRRRGRPRKRKRSTAEEEEEEERRRQAYEQIPLGRQGAHMMTSFGDGPYPIPDAVSTALLGARKLLQATIQDARALKRQNSQQFMKAQAEVARYVNKGRKAPSSKNKLKKEAEESKAAAAAAAAATTSKGTAGSPLKSSNKPKPVALANPEMLYRAFVGWDKMSRHTKCGFNFEQLRCLFPEEMRAYTRWNQMKEAAEEKEHDAADAGAGGEGKDQPGGGGREDDDNSNNDDDPLKDGGGGHLQERAVQFDLRTNLMDERWYMKFSEHRKGSFLPRRIRQEGDAEWDENRKNNNNNNKDQKDRTSGNGKKETGVWANMSAKSARFLHWIGFDPDKGLPPPNDETTQALAFLGYDFVGRIVEKAIFLKNLATAKRKNEEVDERTILLELEDGEQLQKADIDLALQKIRPAAMYSNTAGLVSTWQKPLAQLYFGPGFEDRLEMELDELMCTGDKAKREDLTEEETKIRTQEDKLFAKMAELPTTNNAVLHLLGKEQKGKEENQKTKSESKGEEGKDGIKPISKPNETMKDLTAKQNKEDREAIEGQQKKRRRPLKRKELIEWGEELAG